ncbi:MAG TPA: YIP1 family protein [Longimicrobiales bacterium]|nr:YIP1 family protein [Longimicrobiales bacterium]
MNDPGVAADTAPAPQTVSRWEDYIDVFFSPVELFRRRAADRVAPPLLTLLALSVVLYLVLLPANMMIMRASVAENPQAAEMMAGRLGTFMAIAGSIGQPIMYLFILTLTAILLWITGRFADVRIEFSRAMLIATYGGFIFLLAQTVALALIMVLGADSIDMVRSMSFGPLRFTGTTDMNKLVLAFIGRIDLFAIWQAAIWAIGLRTVYQLSTRRAAIIAAVVWLLLTIPNLVGLLLSGLSGAPPA